jgi:hypothetical protein
MEIVKHDFHFFMSEAPTKDAIYTLTIESVLEDEIVLGLMTYTMTLITRSRGGALQILEIDKYISILGVKRCYKKHISLNRRFFGNNIT